MRTKRKRPVVNLIQARDQSNLGIAVACTRAITDIIRIANLVLRADATFYEIPYSRPCCSDHDRYDRVIEVQVADLHDDLKDLCDLLHLRHVEQIGYPQEDEPED